nr:uncharacterized protein CTRU02_00783 [Colletotrichum truncatum]KAF6802034.1 hypothetical protein CTRU02_00783 [Colletotrichum truncatum]
MKNALADIFFQMLQEENLGHQECCPALRYREGAADSDYHLGR